MFVVTHLVKEIAVVDSVQPAQLIIAPDSATVLLSRPAGPVDNLLLFRGKICADAKEKEQRQQDRRRSFVATFTDGAS